jgi:hypothetical protein
MNTLVDFNSARHGFKHGQPKEDVTKWLTLKEVAAMLDLTVPKTRAMIQKAIRTQHLKNMTKPGSRGMQALYAMEMVHQLKNIYSAGTLSRPQSKLLNFIPFVGRSYALVSMGKAIYDSGIGQAVIHRLELKKWERKAREFVQGQARPVLLAKWNELKTVAEKDYDLIYKKVSSRISERLAHRASHKEAVEAKSFEKLS